MILTAAHLFLTRDRAVCASGSANRPVVLAEPQTQARVLDLEDTRNREPDRLVEPDAKHGRDGRRDVELSHHGQLAPCRMPGPAAMKPVAMPGIVGRYPCIPFSAPDGSTGSGASIATSM
jgi:hypothetical protein